MSKLALLGGEPVFTEKPPQELFKWPIITQEDIDAATEVIVNNKFSGTDITVKFEEEFAQWQGRDFALAFTNGTMSLAAAMFAVGLSEGDEIICPTKTYWASIAQAAWFGAKAVFCNIDENLCMDPADLERCITPRTKAIMVVHYLAYPCDMDAIMEIANRHNLYVIEDVSHAHGSLYKGKKVGNFGHVAAMSMMCQKLFAAGELGMLVTDDRKLYERALAYGHYERNNDNLIYESEELKDFYHMPLGAVKGRANQLCSALARVQLKYFDERCAEVNRAVNYFYDSVEGLPGIKPRRVDGSDGSTMGGFYAPRLMYKPEELEGLSAARYAEAVRAELNGTYHCYSGANFNLHTHKYFTHFDPLHSTVIKTDADVADATLDSAENVYCVRIPWFKHLDREWIDRYVSAYKKVLENYKDLLEGDENRLEGDWYGSDYDKDYTKKKT